MSYQIHFVKSLNVPLVNILTIMVLPLRIVIYSLSWGNDLVKQAVTPGQATDERSVWDAMTSQISHYFQTGFVVIFYLHCEFRTIMINWWNKHPWHWQITQIGVIRQTGFFWDDICEFGNTLNNFNNENLVWFPSNCLGLHFNS